MVNFYKDEDVQTYVFTIMNMVSVLYHDYSIGNAVNVVMVNLMLMDYIEPKLKITHHADNTLRSFCRWQKSINVRDDKDPNHHDVAVLLTRRNICSRRNEPCSTLGLSQVNGLCQPHRSCNINEDTGLSLAYTVAHELGHNFGMQHDGPQNGCVANDKHKYQQIMAAQLNAGSSPIVWSTCSKDAITKFLDRDWGYCLDDEPSEHEYFLDERPPGIKYDADHQCRLQYGEDAKYCDGIDNLCMTLWCRVENKCMTRLEAAAEGTVCTDNKWCSGGQCVPQGETPLAQNGEWGEWGEWSGCSRSCGGGVTYKERHCDNPGPRNGGKYCVGERKRYRICNHDVGCPVHTPNFKDVQCAEYNDIPYKGKIYKWQYVANPRTPCQLHCRPKGHFFSVMLSDMVKDGTSCPGKGPHAMCINGLCKSVGCDWEIESSAREDGCGVCRGDGATCKTIKSHFNKEQGMGYVEATVIPEGARNIRIEEVAEANNYLAIKNDDGQYYLNGGWYIQWNGEYEAAGTVIKYERVGDKETLKAAGPIKEALHIMLLFQSENPGVEFEYTIPNANASNLRIPVFKWIYLDWTHCTHSCGGGTQRSQVVCFDTELGQVDDKYCNSSLRPEDMMRVCNDHICPPRWWPGPWQHCSLTCGDGGVRQRTVLCVRSSAHHIQEALEDWECEEEKPVEQEPCKHKPLCVTEGNWQMGPWSNNCTSDPCEIEVRDVYCDSGELTCDIRDKPNSVRQCQENVVCGYWKPDQWSVCTRTCGGGVQFRSVDCVDGQLCLLKDKPITEQQCANISCPTTVPNLLNTTESRKFSSTENFMKETTIYYSTNVPTGTTTQKLYQKNTRIQDLKPKVKDEFKKSNVIFTQDVPKVPLTTRTSTSTTTFATPSEVQVVNEIFENNDDSLKSLSTTEPLSSDNHMWVPLFWGECSTKCGPGTKTRLVKCFSKITLEEDREDYCIGQEKPSDMSHCDNKPCLEWTVGEWEQCSEICGNGTRSRTVSCAEEDMCNDSNKAPVTQHCFEKECVTWQTGDWSKCSKSCGGGYQTREVKCYDLKSQNTSVFCDRNDRPPRSMQCNTKPCSHGNEVQRSRGSYMCYRDVLSPRVCKALRYMRRCWQSVVQLNCCRTCQVMKLRALKERKAKYKT